MAKGLVFIVVLLVLLLEKVACQTPPDLPGSGTRFFFNGPLSNISQILSTRLGNGQNSENILWCQSSDTSSILSWVLPDGSVLTGDTSGGGLQVISFPGVIGLFAPGGPSQIQFLGIYICRVEQMSTVMDDLKIWILNSESLPLLDANTQQCQVLTITPPINTNLTVEIMSGPPQTIKCRDQLNQPINITVSIRILTAIVPARVLVIIIFISPSRPSNITCEVSNEAGSGGTFECQLNRNIPSPPTQGVSLFLSNSGSELPPHSQISVFAINAFEGLWCLTSNLTRGISSWTLPDGTTLNSNFPSAQGAQVVEEPGALGLFAAFNSTRLFLLGIYVCRTFDSNCQLQELNVLITDPLQLSGPVINQSSAQCSISTAQPLSLLLRLEIAKGAPIVAECFNEANNQSLVITNTSITVLQPLVPVRYAVAIIFIIPFSRGRYTCFIRNFAGRSENTTCVVEGSNLLPPTEVEAIRSRDDPTTILVTWECPTPTNPFLVGFEVIFVAGNGSITTVIEGPDSEEALVTGLSPFLNYTITVVALGGFNNGTVALPSEPSIPTFIPELKASCLPAHGHRIKLTLKRKRQPLDVSGLCSEVDQLFLLLAINSTLINTQALDPQCSIARSRNFNCQEGGNKPGEKKDDLEIEIIVLVLCNPCEVLNSDEERPPMKRPPRKVLKDKMVPKKVVIKNKRYDVKSKDEGMEDIFCDSVPAEMEDTCDCPKECIL